ncbi:MAG: MerR family transcriptional regulator [Gaiellales bacterium]|nr:MerR family transcriptional regulator [Gaiellales bacterium]
MNQDERSRPLFMISVASELAEMHPQTLRMYERRGLICPRRSVKQTRLYSLEDVERLRYIQKLTNELGLNLAGVERVLELEAQVRRLQHEVERMGRRLEKAIDEAAREAEAIHRSYRRELITVRRGELVPRRR